MTKIILSIWYAITRGIAGLFAALFIVFLMAAGSDIPEAELAGYVTFLLLGLPSTGHCRRYHQGAEVMTTQSQHVDRLKQIAAKPLDPEQVLLNAVAYAGGVLQGLDEAKISNLSADHIKGLEPVIAKASETLQAAMDMYLESRT